MTVMLVVIATIAGIFALKTLERALLGATTAVALKLHRDAAEADRMTTEVFNNEHRRANVEYARALGQESLRQDAARRAS